MEIIMCSFRFGLYRVYILFGGRDGMRLVRVVFVYRRKGFLGWEEGDVFVVVGEGILFEGWLSWSWVEVRGRRGWRRGR